MPAAPLAVACFLHVALVAFTAFPAVPARAATYDFPGYRVEVDPPAPFNAPMEGVKVRLRLTNTGVARVFTGSLSATVPESGQPMMVTPQPRHLAAGESMAVTGYIDAAFLSLSPGTPAVRTARFNVAGNPVDVPFTVTNWSSGNGAVITPPAGQGIVVSVRVTDEGGNPITAGVAATAGPATVALTPTGQAGTYGATLPPSSRWVLGAEANGRTTGYLFLSDPSRYTGQSLVLRARTGGFTYGAAQALETGIGPWQARLTASQDAMLLTSGMERWDNAIKPSIAQAKLRLYGTDGAKRWEYAPGYEAWGADISADGRWAVVATLDPSGSSSGVAGPPGTLTLLDAATGLPVWQQVLDVAFMGAPDIPGPLPSGIVTNVREVKFSPDATLIALGDQLGNLTVVRRSDHTVAWRANLSGDVRGIRFSPDGAHAYAAFGSGLTAAFGTSDGAERWRRETFSWVHPEGFALSPDGTRLGVMAQVGDVMMLDAATGAVLWQADTAGLAWWASFSDDGTVFIAGTQTSNTFGYAAADGAPRFALPGGKGGWFAKGARHFLLGNRAVYDQDGTRISNFLTGLEGTRFGNWQAAWVSPDGLTILLGEQQSDSDAMPVFYRIAGAAAPTNPARLANISTRMQVLTGNDVLIGGFIIGGTQAKTVVVRARGPSLVPFGIPNALANPTLQLFSGQAVIASNDDWGTAPNLPALNASGFAPSNALESAILTTLGPGAYTAVVSGASGLTGVGIIEVFEVDHPEIPLLNISTRGQVLTGGDVMIGGFIIQGDAPQTVVVRARGPSLAPFGITNALQDPVLQLFNGQVPIATNDDWQAQAVPGDVAAIQASGFAPGDPREAVIRITLPPGAYTAIVSGKNGTTGVGIIEAFAL